jgi:hypothetical protein
MWPMKSEEEKRKNSSQRRLYKKKHNRLMSTSLTVFARKAAHSEEAQNQGKQLKKIDGNLMVTTHFCLVQRNSLRVGQFGLRQNGDRERTPISADQTVQPTTLLPTHTCLDLLLDSFTT